ncbi:MAG: EAL domain-containing protein, partial [Eubacterium sp.]|nr:EAL domain-containing protein [Eubacterium sp.]
KQMLHEQEIENDMERALEARQFSVYIQPKYDVRDAKIVGGEALVRWIHPSKGMVPPGDFISIFEKNGFIIRLDYYVWEETCKVLSELKKKGLGGKPVSINVSRAHFYGVDLQEKLQELIAKYELSPDELELEITETICAEDPDIIYKKIRELQEAGFKVAMDDFGSGYSSLNMLKEMPLDIIKMDLKFLDGGDNEEKSRNILQTLITLAQSLKLSVVVEGVETKEQTEFLQRIGSFYAQGYYFSRPVDCKTYEEMLTKDKQGD